MASLKQQVDFVFKFAEDLKNGVKNECVQGGRMSCCVGESMRGASLAMQMVKRVKAVDSESGSDVDG
ncbi:hypothetical protein VNO78_27036 [Psophocarpus tetragonolobus]|uniref:Uncharacterized protein n=1 Tax=Psophocarpus tetragonolobus TaxID=3891 RepID=A0AAN9XAL2_PSOTE